MRNENISLSGPILKSQARKFARQLGDANFKCNDGWISRFQNRHNTSISLGKISGEANSVNCADVRNRTEQIWNKIKVDYKSDEIFNIDDTGLFYHLDKTLRVKEEKCIGGKLSKDRVTVLVGAHIFGSEKR